MNIKKLKTLYNNERLPILVKEKGFRYETTDTSVCSPEMIGDILKTALNHHLETEEITYLLCFNTKLKLIGIFTLAIGTHDKALISPREIFEKVLIAGASGFALAHNHPSGDPLPSEEDISVTKRVLECSKLMGLSLIDHIIVTETNITSIRRQTNIW